MNAQHMKKIYLVTLKFYSLSQDRPRLRETGGDGDLEWDRSPGVIKDKGVSINSDEYSEQALTQQDRHSRSHEPMVRWVFRSRLW